MKKHNNRILFSATDLNEFIECRYKAFLTVKNIETPLPKKEADDHDRLLKKKGLEHESRYLKFLKASGYRIIEIPTQGKLEKRVKMTMEAMENGPDFIFQAALLNDQWHGYVDLLKRVERPSQFGSFSYEAVDVKLSKRPKPSHIIQLCVYSDLLQQCQGTCPHRFSVILNGNEEESFQFSDFAQYYATIKQKFEAFALLPSENLQPLPCISCVKCQWHELCDEQWKKDDHLSQIADIRRSQILKLEENGIRTIQELAHLDPKAVVPNLSQHTLDRLRSQARLQNLKHTTGENHFELLPAVEGKGFARLPRPDSGDLFFDMEGDPHHHPNGLEYLFGIYYLDNATPVFKPFWAHNEVEEKRAFQELMDFITTHLNLHPKAYIYHYNHYEDTAIKRLAAKYGTREDEVDDILRKRKLVDLYKAVYEALRISEPSYSLKNLETFYMGKRHGDVSTAMGSIVMYDQWQTTRDDALLKQIVDYNEVDCRSLYLLREWLLKLRPKAISWFELATIETSEEKQSGQKEVEETRARYEKALLQGVSDQDLPFRELVSHILEFHRRESKPTWWALFSRQDKEINELMEDTECLTGLEIDPANPPRPEKRSIVHTYRFPQQDYKLKIGEDCSLIYPLGVIGKIHSLNANARTVGIKSTKGPLPQSSSITIYPSHSGKPLRDAIYRFANAVLTGSNPYWAVEAFLRREPPKLEGKQPNTPIIDNNENILEGASKAVANLQNSYLFIQGPPGAGKTYTSSHIIVDLIKSGKRVGISSNSHKAISNLLASIEKAAKEKKIRFYGQKKSDKDKSETHFDGEMIKDVFENKDVDLKADLIAGTAWLFAREDFDQKFDYLFIDEAGQVSLANLVAMGMSAKNIVLVGDQMQLSQPLKGVHPGSSGMSSLEYLLQGKPIISPERGIFLSTTWRMHEKICRFISDAVYDGQLHPERNNQEQALILSETANPDLIEHGIRFIAAEHKDCGQQSKEEGEIILKLYANLMTQRYRDREGNVQRMTSENVLVVTPYNMQVNYLKSILPENARVGTVDKFQGQEAEVVLVSMTTSNADELPRDMEFLYSKNRLNVAISRARTLAIVIANPELLEIPCSNADQMRLVNTLCWVKEYSVKQTISWQSDC